MTSTLLHTLTATSNSNSIPLYAAPEDEKTLAAKSRIITHMNADHSTSLSLYLRHFCGVSRSQAQTAQLTAITKEHLIIESGAGRNMIPLQPPLKEYSDARERMVALHQDALQGLGLSDAVVDAYYLPNRTWQWALSILCLACYVTFPVPEFSAPPAPGSALGLSSLPYYLWSVGGTVPQAAHIVETRGPKILKYMLAAHAVEAVGLMAARRLRKHQVPVFSATWFGWVASTLFNGVGSWKRFDGVVQDKERESKARRGGGKH